MIERMRGLAPFLLVSLLAGCDGADATTEEQAEEPAEAVGVTADGEQIIFAGPRRSPAKNQPAGRQSRDYVEESLRRTPSTPDPENGEFTLEEAVVGMPVDGTLVAEIGTEFGTMLCDLYADRAPRTVANFVGLARGLRPWWDARAGEWVRRPYYRGLIFHRVVPEYLVQGGDYLGDGTGTVGYTIPDETDDTLAHDARGLLCMANHEGPNSAGAQFFITDGPAPELDREGGFTIFGRCQNLDVVAQIARVPQDPEAGNRPRTPVHITRMMIQRVEGGAAQAQITRPQLPEGEPAVPRGASPGPGEDPRRRYPEGSPLPQGDRRGPPSPPIPQRDPHGH